jgi:exopolysaccharide biosynthesis polyprenyl glycosylphosphotransferase
MHTAKETQVPSAWLLGRGWQAGRVQLARKGGTRLILAMLPILDALTIGASFALAYYARFANPLWPYNAIYSSTFYFQLMVGLILTWLILFAIYGLYEPRNLLSGTEEYARVVNACTIGIVAVLCYSFFVRGLEQDISRGWLLVAWALSLPIVGAGRFTFRRFIYYMRRRGLCTALTLVIGANDEGRLLARQWKGASSAGVNVVGFVDDEVIPGTMIEGLPVLGNCDALKSLVKRLKVDELVVVPTAVSRETLLEIYRTLGTSNGVQVRLSPGLYELFTTGVRVQEVGFVPLVSLNKLRITGVDAVLKTILDYGITIPALIFLTPLLLVIALLVKLDSPGPVIYRRRVVGTGGREFDAFKFRTMRGDADVYLEQHPELLEELKHTGKLKNDPRVTRLGRFLRTTSLDELPQLFNVLLGQMSLVGPRMISPPELDKFGKWRHNLLTVKPGITGLWQVSGRSDLRYEDRVRLDMHYIRNYTIWLDMRLLFNTLGVVLRKKGAY